MLKISQFIFLFLFSEMLPAQDITATQKIPVSALPGTDFIIETTINKGGNTEFMKFYQQMPAGFTAVDIESKGGAFTFADGGAKVVWITPPADPVFTISFRVTVAGGISGAKNLPGKISYMNHNERKTFDFPESSITIGLAGSPVKKEVPGTNPVVSTQPAKTEPVKTEPIKTEPVKDNVPTVVKTTPPPAKEKTEPGQPSTFSKVPTTALPSSSAGKTYKVQIGAFSQKPKVDGVPQVSTFVLDNGITKYFSGNFATYEEAVARKKEMVEKGFQGAFIVVFENGKPVK